MVKHVGTSSRYMRSENMLKELDCVFRKIERLIRVGTKNKGTRKSTGKCKMSAAKGAYFGYQATR